MNEFRVERPNYFTGEALLTADFICAQGYQIAMLAVNNATLHSWGIAQGLEVAPLAQAAGAAPQVRISRGVALDALGRQIILLQPQVLTLSEAEVGVQYYITIRYHEVLADLSNETGTPGYKRIVAEPQLRYQRNLNEPGRDILLAVISLSSQSSINSLTYQSGRNQRRYVGSSVGAIRFISEGAGVNAASIQSGNSGTRSFDQVPDFSSGTHLTAYASISAKRSTSGSVGNGSDSDEFLEFDAPRSQFMGLLGTRNNLGIGVDLPGANLQLDAITNKGTGTIKSTGDLVTFSKGPVPFLQPGDSLSSFPGLGEGEVQTRTVSAIMQDGLQVRVDAAFFPALTQSPYTYQRGKVMQVSVATDSPVLSVNLDGSVGLGLAGKTGGDQNGTPALLVATSRNVGIGLNNTQPSAALEVNGQILATSVAASGKIVAQSFEGNGSKLEGLSILSYWTKVDPNADHSSLYYISGNVGIMDSNPQAPLSVGSSNAMIGNGVLTSLLATSGSNKKVTGYQTTFLDQVRVGDELFIGTLNEQRSTVASKPTDNRSLTLVSQFVIPVINSAYSILTPDGTQTSGSGTISSNGTSISGSADTQFTSLNPGDILIIPRFTVDASNGVPMQGTVVSVESQTELTLSGAFSADFTAATSAYMISSGLLAQFRTNAGNGISSSEETASQPPALLVVSNNDTASPNTLAINIELEEVNRNVALQVKGAISVSGDFSIDGDFNIDGDVSVSGTLAVKGGISGGSLAVPGLQSNSAGNMQMFGTRVAQKLSGTSATGSATTDGFLLASVGDPSRAQFGLLTANTRDASNNITSIAYATAARVSYVHDKGKKDHDMVLVGSLTLPVKKGESWSLQLQLDNTDAGPATVNYYWLPLGNS